MQAQTYCPAFQDPPTPCPIEHEACQEQHIHHERPAASRAFPTHLLEYGDHVERYCPTDEDICICPCRDCHFEHHTGMFEGNDAEPPCVGCMWAAKG